jgi:hypothetical protein
MSNVVIKMAANSNISYDNTYETYIPVEEWAEMDPKEREAVILEAFWDDIDASAVDEETGEYLA